MHLVHDERESSAPPESAAGVEAILLAGGSGGTHVVSLVVYPVHDAQFWRRMSHRRRWWRPRGSPTPSMNLLSHVPGANTRVPGYCNSGSSLAPACAKCSGRVYTARFLSSDASVAARTETDGAELSSSRADVRSSSARSAPLAGQTEMTATGGGRSGSSASSLSTRSLRPAPGVRPPQHTRPS